ncbi:hypothetical protein [Microbispora sp. NPDC049125]|uniref:hypothetical protein n=1 Tax=Microbispora sp. NPDC049125 TaxID=3154929 RepID=UPI003465BDDC
MLKRLFFAAAMAASTLLVTGTGAAHAQASDASVRHVVPAQPNPGLCKQRDDGCTYCYDYRTARWDQQSCDGGSGE